MPAPSLPDVERIADMTEPAARNREITRCYHDLSRSICEQLGDVANWCTFAGWASAQAGSTIRGEDLERALAQRVQHLPALAQLAGPHADAVRNLIRSQAPLRRAAAAVARGNLKVFAEIGREFARFLSGIPLPQFLAGLRAGPPPDGQQLLREAFAAYTEAMQTPEGAARAQRILYANLLVGLHEQTRLQPEIREALDVARQDLERLRPLALRQLLPSWWQRARAGIARLFGRKLPLDVIVDRIFDELCGEARELLTAEMMTLELPTGTVRLGRDLAVDYPPGLQQLDYAPLLNRLNELQQKHQAVPRDRDWSDFDYRMFYISRLFRAYQERAELLQSAG